MVQAAQGIIEVIDFMIYFHTLFANSIHDRYRGDPRRSFVWVAYCHPESTGLPKWRTSQPILIIRKACGGEMQLAGRGLRWRQFDAGSRRVLGPQSLFWRPRAAELPRGSPQAGGQVGGVRSKGIGSAHSMTPSCFPYLFSHFVYLLFCLFLFF